MDLKKTLGVLSEKTPNLIHVNILDKALNVEKPSFFTNQTSFLTNHK